MIKIKKITLSKLHLLEVNSILFDVVRIVDRHNPEALRLSDTYNLVLEQNSKTNLLTVPYRGHYLTKLIDRFHNKRLIYASKIFMHMRATDRLNNMDTEHMMDEAYPIVKSYLPNLRENQQHIVTQLIKGFFYELTLNPEAMEALMSLGLKTDVEELEKANNEFERISDLRTYEISKRPKTNKKAVAKEAVDVLRLFFDQLNHFKRFYTELNYIPLISELNELLTEHSKNIKTRGTLNKKRADQKKDTSNKTLIDKSAKKSTVDKIKDLPSDATNSTGKIEKGKENVPLQNLMKIIKKNNGKKGKT